jgi:plastocyanin
VAAAGLVPALARGEAPRSADASVVAFDNGFRDGAQADPNDNTVEIAPGGTVSFGYPTGGSSHNVVFDVAQPSSCVQQTGVVITAAPPLPGFAEPPGWSGECTFNAAGTYTFFCNAHPTMTGKVIVGDPSTPTPTATATDTPVPTPIATPVVTPAPTPTPWASLDAPGKSVATVAAFVKGKLSVTAHCSTPSSGTLTLTVSKADAKKLKLKGVELARAGAQCTGNGRLTVTVRPSAAAKKALKKWRKALKATATLTLGSAKSARTITLAGAR